jgi:hypothetical protein
MTQREVRFTYAASRGVTHTICSWLSIRDNRALVWSSVHPSIADTRQGPAADLAPNLCPLHLKRGSRTEAQRDADALWSRWPVDLDHSQSLRVNPGC